MSAVLETKGLTIKFGGHTAVDRVSIALEEKKLTSIIGPNGAGKTTLFNLISGELAPTRGQIYYKGRDITKMSATNRARLGIGRSFQITNVFPNLTVLENVRLAVQSNAKVRYQIFAHFRHYKQFHEKAHHLLESVFLADKADALAVNLAHGEQRKLEIAMLLALDTDVLLLDEPTAGMAVEEVPVIMDVIKEIHAREDRTIVLIEHKMDMIMDLSDEVLVLFHGELLAHGSPEEIVKNETVQSAYLGGAYDEQFA
ncbi:Ribose import ATP-binding protein RbsA [Lentibacillus sp. JNUCC-1]|uniref:ABC transporter ATP-binding protein n=1 Tax=Lentibacillus sp. JNUCC-1 TaxID=2654513 RepID=UPI0012E7C1F3|nr:ABC transporter ATP-binding protein [Lentibacillus sp. JNUCC-1]MUV37690.1 Ribose import ATP-binding protein RbsA [Lentibacillus sp. JNUCC-1]